MLTIFLWTVPTAEFRGFAKNVKFKKYETLEAKT